MPTCRPPDDWEKNATPESKVRMDTLASEVQREWGGRNVRGTGYSLALGGGELGKRLEEGGVAGVITSRPKLNFLQGSGGWGTIEVFETYNTHAPTVALSCELRPCLSPYREQPGPKLRRSRRQAPRRTARVQHRRDDEGKEARRVCDVVGALRPWDWLLRPRPTTAPALTMLEAMRILKVYPHPKRTILVGHWSAEEEGEVGSKAFTEDHPEVLKGLQALFNQDNGTGRIVRMGGGGLPNAAEHIAQWLDKIPTEWKAQINFAGAGRPAGVATTISRSRLRTSTPGLGALRGTTTYIGTPTATRTTRSPDDLKSNATLQRCCVSPPRIRR
jgi:hypothetical protein